MSIPRLPWKRASDPRVEAQLDDFDDVMDMVLQRWRAADIAKVDLAWEKIVSLLPDERADVWLDNLQRCVRTGANWSPAFPVVEKPVAVSAWPQVLPDTKFRIVSDTKWIPSMEHPITPARARRESRFADVQRLASGGVRQKDIAVQLGISQATVSHWLRGGIDPPRTEGRHMKSKDQDKLPPIPTLPPDYRGW